MPLVQKNVLSTLYWAQSYKSLEIQGRRWENFSNFRLAKNNKLKNSGVWEFPDGLKMRWSFTLLFWSRNTLTPDTRIVDQLFDNCGQKPIPAKSCCRSWFRLPASTTFSSSVRSFCFHWKICPRVTTTTYGFMSAPTSSPSPTPWWRVQPTWQPLSLSTGTWMSSRLTIGIDTSGCQDTLKPWPSFCAQH